MADLDDVPQLDGLLETALYVADVARSVEFYGTVLGLRRIDADERVTALAVGPGQVLLICAARASAELPGTAHHAEGRQHVAFAVPRSALGAWEARLARAAIEIVARRRWSRGGESVYFRDPDGHLVELASPGVWSVY